MVEVTREQHALIHWGYWCNDLKPLLEVCNPPQWVIDMIPLEDVRDSGAASYIALGEIEQIDMSGENHPMYGKKQSPETREKKSAALRGRKRPEEVIKKISASKMGHEVTEETKEKLRQANTGRKHTEEAKRKISKNHARWQKGKIRSEEHRKKLSESLKGRTPWNKGKGMSRLHVNKKARERYARKKAETQGEGTLEGFI